MRIMVGFIAASMLSTRVAAQRAAPGAVGGNGCGESVNGVALCLEPTSIHDVLSIEVRNVSAADVTIDIGIMLANGARQYPTAVTLSSRDSAGTEREGTLIDPPGAAGRVDPFILSLPAGASFRLPLRLSRYMFTSTGTRDGSGLVRSRWYAIRARLTGRRPEAAELSLDVKGLALAPYWSETVISNAVTIVEPSGRER